MKQNNFASVNVSKDELAYAVASMSFDECREIILSVDQIYGETEMTESLIIALTKDLKGCYSEEEISKFKDKVIKILS